MNEIVKNREQTPEVFTEHNEAQLQEIEHKLNALARRRVELSEDRLNRVMVQRRHEPLTRTGRTDRNNAEIDRLEALRRPLVLRRQIKDFLEAKDLSELIESVGVTTLKELLTEYKTKISEMGVPTESQTEFPEVSENSIDAMISRALEKCRDVKLDGSFMSNLSDDFDQYLNNSEALNELFIDHINAQVLFD